MAAMYSQSSQDTVDILEQDQCRKRVGDTNLLLSGCSEDCAKAA